MDLYFSSSSIVDKENLEAMQDFFRNLPANFPKLEMPDGTMKRRKRDGEKGNTMNQNQAINELESLGCTVYGTTKDDSEAKTLVDLLLDPLFRLNSCFLLPVHRLVLLSNFLVSRFRCACVLAAKDDQLWQSKNIVQGVEE